MTSYLECFLSFWAYLKQPLLFCILTFYIKPTDHRFFKNSCTRLVKRVVLFYHIQSNDSLSNDTRFLHKLAKYAYRKSCISKIILLETKNLVVAPCKQVCLHKITWNLAMFFTLMNIFLKSFWITVLHCPLLRFTGKHQHWSIFLNKVADQKPACLCKGSSKGAFLKVT